MAGEEPDSKIKIGRASKSTNTVGLDLLRENCLYGRKLIGKKGEGQWLGNRPAPSSFCGLKDELRWTFVAGFIIAGRGNRML